MSLNNAEKYRVPRLLVGTQKGPLQEGHTRDVGPILAAGVRELRRPRLVLPSFEQICSYAGEHPKPVRRAAIAAGFPDIVDIIEALNEGPVKPLTRCYAVPLPDTSAEAQTSLYLKAPVPRTAGEAKQVATEVIAVHGAAAAAAIAHEVLNLTENQGAQP
jgi:hypothetical protein